MKAKKSIKLLIGLLIMLALAATIVWTVQPDSGAGLTAVAGQTAKKRCFEDENGDGKCDKVANGRCKTGQGTGAPDCKPPKKAVQDSTAVAVQ